MKMITDDNYKATRNFNKNMFFCLSWKIAHYRSQLKTIFDSCEPKSWNTNIKSSNRGGF